MLYSNFIDDFYCCHPWSVILCWQIEQGDPTSNNEKGDASVLAVLTRREQGGRREAFRDHVPPREKLLKQTIWSKRAILLTIIYCLLRVKMHIAPIYLRAVGQYTG